MRVRMTAISVASQGLCDRNRERLGFIDAVLTPAWLQIFPQSRKALRRTLKRIRLMSSRRVLRSWVLCSLQGNDDFRLCTQYLAKKEYIRQQGAQMT